MPRKLWLIALVVVPALGCGGPVVAPVSGQITVGGKPLGPGTITFIPNGEGKAAMGAVDEKGKYQLTTFKEGDGALVGSHKVTIELRRVDPLSAPQPKSLEEETTAAAGGIPRPKRDMFGTLTWLAPERYSNPSTTDLKATVKNEPNTIDFDLPTK